jgi:dihydroorotase
LGEAIVSKYDLVVKGGEVIDVGTDTIGRHDVAVSGDRIVAIAKDIPESAARQVVRADGAIVTAGLIDIHAHVFEHGTDFGLNPDDAGIHSGCTTLVDQGSCGGWTFDPFKAFIIDRAKTEVLCFISANLSGTLRGCKGGPIIQCPDYVDIDVLARFAAKYPTLIRGVKGHGESGSWSRWGSRMLQMAREAADRTGLPLYVHTGELWPADERNRPAADSVLPEVLRHVRPGDILAHVYSAKDDGMLGARDRPSDELLAALKAGVLTDIGHGVNFSFRVARCMMEHGVLPDTIGSDVHGDFFTHHNDATLDYSLCGGLSKLHALGIDLKHLIAGATLRPARILGMESEIGTLRPGSRADITVLDRVAGDWTFTDCDNETLHTRERFVPKLVVRRGEVIQPHNRLLRDVVKRAA